MKSWTAVLIVTLAISTIAARDHDETASLDRASAEDFLRTAEVIELEDFDNRGVTSPKKATLSDGTHTLHAVFKNINTFYPKKRLSNGSTVFGMRDTYKHEIAAYELDKLLGFDMVPPTIHRKIGMEHGSLQLWVYDAMTEWQRSKERGFSPPDLESWNNQMSTVRTFHQLIWDSDYNNVSNLLIDRDWKIWIIDSSRAFRTDRKLRLEDALTRFSRPLLSALRNLDREQLDTAMRPWLSPKQVKGLWHRRNRILELARMRVDEFGAETVLYD